MYTRRFVLSLLIPAFSLLPAAHAQFVQQGGKLVGTGAVGAANQGQSVSLSADGSTAIVGGPDDNNGLGAAWVYVRANGVWNQQGPKLVGSGAVGQAAQGVWVAMSADGNGAIVGGFNDDSTHGATWVYSRTNGVWSQQGPKLVGSGAVGYAWQGRSVALSADGNTALVGGPYDNLDSGNGHAGAVWLYTRTNGVWSQQGPKLVGAGALGSAEQGFSASLSDDGNTAIVGGSGDDANTGAAWVYTRTNGVWTQQAKLVGAGSAGSSYQGMSVALSRDGDTAIVGGPGASSGGAAWVYVHANGLWTQQGGKLVAAGGDFSDILGSSVALSGDGSAALVGGYSVNSVGGAWLYGRTDGVWKQQGGKLLGAGAVGNPWEGVSVALSADGITAIVGGPQDNSAAGAAWVYTRAGMYFSLSAPASALAGVPFNFTLKALNADNSSVPGYAGMVHFASSDPLAALPPDSLVTNGVGTFQATFSLGGTQTISATDIVNPSIAGTSGQVAVQSAVPARLLVSVPASVTPGAPFSFSVAAVDASGNQSYYQGRVRFSSSDGTAVLPSDATFVVPEIYGFTAILKAAGNQTITATDTANPSIAGTSTSILVAPSPVTNLAVGKIATQSSTLPGYPAAAAGSAVDGVTNGSFFNASVSSTNLETNPWWQVDLGTSTVVTAVVIWNRTDCCASRLNDYWVFVSDTPFGATDTPDSLQNRAGIWSSHQTSAPSPSARLPVGTRGRYVRAQLSGTDYLSLAEVQVLSSPVPDWNVAQGKTATQSSTLPGSATAAASSAVDGNTDGNFFDGSVTSTNLETEPWWQVDLGSTTMIRNIVINNRTDCCGSRLGPYYVFVAGTPFAATDTISALTSRPGVSWTVLNTAPNPTTLLYWYSQGRYLRVQVPGTNYLSLAEVQVLGQQDVAQGKVATQSSTLPGYPSASASSAVDGSTDGNFFHGSVTSTNADVNAWWQVDLGVSTSLGGIQVWNRTDCCSSRLSDYWIFVSENPFAASDTPATLLARADTRAADMSGVQGNEVVYFFNFDVRYVRIQLKGTGYLSLAEVQVFGPDLMQ